MYFDLFDSPFGKVHILVDELGLRQLSLSLNQHPFEYSQEWEHDPARLAEFKRQILAFLEGKLHTVTLPLAPEGTAFQHQVWNAVKQIPYGETRSYADIANAIGNPHAYRAVGMANNVNPLPLIIPCHRVIGINGALTGYRYGLVMKKKLLQMEEDNRLVEPLVKTGKNLPKR